MRGLCNGGLSDIDAELEKLAMKPWCARAEQGYEVANDIGMSRQNVDHYIRFRDQMKVGADGQKRLRLIGKED
jgi:hypothetical protein